MKFNPSKCNILSISRSTPLHKFYTLCGTILDQVSESKYLGVTISNDLMWSKHIQNITSKASSTVGLLRRNLARCPIKLREQAYISLIRSRLEYCAAVWDPHLVKDVKSLETIQRRAARFVVQDFSWYNRVTPHLQDLNWAPLKDRRRNIRLTLLYKIVTGNISVQMAEGTLSEADPRTRKKNSKKYKHLTGKTPQYKNSFFVNTIPEWNKLHESCITADTVTAFKARLSCTP